VVVRLQRQQRRRNSIRRSRSSTRCCRRKTRERSAEMPASPQKRSHGNRSGLSLSVSNRLNLLVVVLSRSKAQDYRNCLREIVPRRNRKRTSNCSTATRDSSLPCRRLNLASKPSHTTTTTTSSRKCSRPPAPTTPRPCTRNPLTGEDRHRAELTTSSQQTLRMKTPTSKVSRLEATINMLLRIWLVTSRPTAKRACRFLTSECGLRRQFVHSFSQRSKCKKLLCCECGWTSANGNYILYGRFIQSVCVSV